LAVIVQARPAATRVPFLDLAPQHRGLKAEILGDLADLVESGAFTNGPAVAEFEQVFSAYAGVRRCVGVASGLDALRLALIAGGLQRGDEVVVPALTFAATFEAVTQAGGVPVPADVSLADYTIDPAAAASATGRRTRFILPVHLYGQLADVAALTTFNVPLVEDACQAHGAARDGFRAGTAGVAAAFSFYPGKNLGAFGDAGALVTNDDMLAGLATALREHGQRAKYRHDREGYTARLDTVQAAVLLRKLPRLDGWNDERRQVAAEYGERLAEVGDLRLPPVPEGSEPVWHLYAVWTEQPAALAAFLDERGVQTGRHYPEPPHLSAAYARFGWRPGAFPVAEDLAAHLLSLPIFPGMTEEQMDAVVRSVEEFFHG
jgi:dTDP-4-amino-4,6-dideoxygalactose transaminase